MHLIRYSLVLLFLCASTIEVNGQEVFLTVGDQSYLSIDSDELGSTIYVVVSGDVKIEGNLNNDKVLEITRNLDNEGIYTGSGELKFTGAQQSTILCTDSIQILTIEKSGASTLIANDSLYIKSALRFKQGKLNLNGFTLHANNSNTPALHSSDSMDSYAYGGTWQQNLQNIQGLYYPLFLGLENEINRLELNLNQLTLEANAFIRVQSLPGPHPSMPASSNYFPAHHLIETSGMVNPQEIEIQTTVLESEGTGDLSLAKLQVWNESQWIHNSSFSPPVQSTYVADTYRVHNFLSNDLGDVQIFLSPSACPGDLNGDGQINTADVVFMLGEFGCSDSCNTDINGDEVVNTADIVALLGYFGNSCP